MFLLLLTFLLFVSTARSEEICDPKLPDRLDAYCAGECGGFLECESNVCACPRGYSAYANNERRICKRNCSSDETVIATADILYCAKKCNVSEVRVESECFPSRLLREPCMWSEQCVSLFAECSFGECSCSAGFFASDDGYCVPKKFGCQFGVPLSDMNGQVVPCEVTATEDAVVDTCPSGSFCQVYMPFFTVHGQQGHCCPKIRDECPVGEALVAKTCAECPQTTHYCHNTLCCARPCHQGFVFFSDRCYPEVQIRDRCEHHVQCEHLNAKCISHECSCVEGTEEIRGICEQRCSNSMVDVSGECAPKRMLGESCTHDEVCPKGAACYQGFCRCSCHLVHVTDLLCAPPAMCPHTRFSVLPMPATAVRDGIFCRTGFNASFDVLKVAVPLTMKCPPGHFCMDYQPNHGIGVCCLTLEPVCPDGSIAHREMSCEPGHDSACPEGQFCYGYSIPGDSSRSSTSFVCCPHAPSYYSKLLPFQ